MGIRLLLLLLLLHCFQENFSTQGQRDEIARAKPKYNSNTGNGKSYDTTFYKDKAVLVLSPSDNFSDGIYKVTATVKEPGLKKQFQKQCEFEMMSEPPILIFTNGRVHYLNEGDAYLVDTKNSISKVPLKTTDLKWTTKCEKFAKRRSDPACRREKCPTWQIGLAHNLKPLICFYSVEIKVWTEFHGLEFHEKQTIFYLTSYERKVALTCLRNCDGGQNKFTNPNTKTVVKLECVTRCQKFDGMEAPTVEVKDSDTNDIVPKSKYTLDNGVITIKPNALTYDHTYTVSAKGEDYTAVTFLRTSPEILIPKCTLTPRNGTSLSTIFKVKCSNTDVLSTFYPTNFKVYQKVPNGDDVLVASSNYGKFNFVLGSTGAPLENLYISGNNILYNNYKDKLGDVALETPPVTKSRMETLLDIVSDLSHKGDYARAVQIARGILHEAKAGADVDKGRIFKELIKSLSKIAVESVYSYNRIGGLLKSFYQEIRPEFKEELSGLCKKLSETQLYSLKKSHYNVQMDDEAKALMLPMKECANAVLDHDIVAETDEINVTDPTDLVDEPATVEDYPNYDQAFHSREDETIKNNAIETILLSGQSTALTLNPGEEASESYNHTETKVSKEYGKDLHKKTIEVDGAQISLSLPSDKLKDEKLSTIVTAYNRTLFKTKLDTKVVDVGIYAMRHSTKTTANVRVKIGFDVSNEPFVKAKYTVSVPGPRSSWKEPDIEYAMNVHRLNVMRNQVCSVHFGKLGTGQKLQFVFTNDRRPRLTDFAAENIHVLDPNEEKSHVVSCPYAQLAYDSFIYVAVLPHDDLVNDSPGNVSVDYEVAFASQYCVTYIIGDKSWMDADCNISFIANLGRERIICDCNHTTLFAAMNKKVPNKLDLVAKIEYVTAKFINYTVFIHVAIVFACYCFALIFVLKRTGERLGREKVVFLSDNMKNDRYGYLLVVKTGNMAGAGTTSNVMLQIFGTKSNSKPHVLNYPDPDKKLLQRDSVDWFVLTNDVHLGDVLSVELWFDGIGYRPTWYCENVYLIDLQTRQLWHFDVRQLFSLKNDVSVECKIEPTDVYGISDGVLNTFIKHSKFHVGAENTWNIFTRSHDENFTYPQRLTVILSMIYTTYILVILFLYPPTLRISDAYGSGYFSYKHDFLIICPVTSILSSLINLPFVYFFRNSENESTLFSFYKETKTYSMLATKITWTVLISWITISMLYLLIFGFSVSFHTTYFWICATIISILISVFVVENIYTTIFNIVYAKLEKFNVKHFNFDGILNEIEHQRKILFSIFGEMLLRPYFVNHYRHLTREQILEMMRVEVRRVEVAKTFRDFVLFLIYLFMLYAICFANVDNLDYRSNVSMRKMLNGEFFTKGYRNSQSIENANDIYNYINYTIIPIVHANNWYGNYNTIDAGLMLDFKTKILGVVQLRQQRREQNCNPVHPMNSLKIKCQNDSDTFKNWTHHDGSEITYTLGALDNYSGEGYIANLGRTLYNSYFVINLLKKIKWIDVNTKVLFVDFWTYNPNYNIFNLVKVMFERSPAGRIIKSESVFTTRLLYSSKISEALVITLIVIFIGIILYKTLTSLIRVRKRTKYFFKDFWEILDVLLLILSIAVCGLYFYRQHLIKVLMDNLVNSDNNQFVYYFELLTVAKFNTWLSIALLCLATTRLWKYLRFTVAFRVMERTIWMSSGTLMMTILYQVYMFLIFTIYLHIAFGAIYGPFGSFGGTLKSLLLISMNLFTYFEHFYISHYGSEFYILYTVFILTSNVFFTIYSTIIIMGFKESQIYYSNIPSYYSIKHYWIDQTTYYSELIRRKERRMRAGGDDEDGVVYPKENSKRYADCIVMSNDKMRLMRLIALAVIRKRAAFDYTLGVAKRDVTENQYKLMARITLCLINPARKGKYDEKAINHLFFPGRDVDNTIRFVSNDTILRLEYAAKYILQPEAPKALFEENRQVIHVGGDYKRLECYRDTLELINKSIDNIRIVDKRHVKPREEIAKELVTSVEGARKKKVRRKRRKKESGRSGGSGTE